MGKVEVEEETNKRQNVRRTDKIMIGEEERQDQTKTRRDRLRQEKRCG